MKKKTFSILIASIAFLSTIMAQGTFQPRPANTTDNKGLIFDKETAFDIRLHTNGYAFAINLGTIKSYNRTRYYQIEIGELKHSKEYRNTLELNFNGIADSKPYTFGKQNKLMVIRGGIGEKRYFSEKAKKKGLAVGVSYEAGPVLGLLKPYYLDIKYENDPSTRSDDETFTLKYSPENQDDFLDRKMISGSAGFTKGLKEIKLRPGIQAKAAMHFDWGAFDEYVKGFEAGVMADIFFGGIPIMVPLENVENPPYFVNLYLTLQFGKRR